jgi:hypothetical protein
VWRPLPSRSVILLFRIERCWSDVWLWPVECCFFFNRLRKVAGYWGETETWVTCLVSVQAMEELERFQLPGIVYRSLRYGGPCVIMLKHVVMAAGEWRDNGTRDHVTVSMCIQIAIDKMQLCSLSVMYACPYHNPSTTPALCSQRWHQQTTSPHNAIHTWSAVVRLVEQISQMI